MSRSLSREELDRSVESLRSVGGAYEVVADEVERQNRPRLKPVTVDDAWAAYVSSRHGSYGWNPYKVFEAGWNARGGVS